MNKEEFTDKINSIFEFEQLVQISGSDLLKRIDHGKEISETVGKLKKYLAILLGSEIQGNEDLRIFFNEIEYLRNCIKFPRIIQINSSNVFGFLLDHLKQLYIDDYLIERFVFERCLHGHGLYEKELQELTIEFKSSLTQAIEYLNNSINSDISIAPVLLYYSILNFLNCYNLLNDDNVLLDKVNKTHGIGFEINEADIFKTKLSFKKHSNLHTYINVNKLSFDTNEYELLDALKSIYYLTDLLKRKRIKSNVIEILDLNNDGLLASPCGTYPSRMSINMDQFSELTGFEIKNENAIKVVDYLLPEFKEFLGYNMLEIRESYIQKSRLGFPVAVIDCCPQYIWQKDIIEFLSSHRDQNSNRFIIIENKTKINDTLIHIYSSSFLFGTISRYYPKLWSQYVTKSENKVFIERFIRSTAIFVLYKFLTLFSREHLVFK